MLPRMAKARLRTTIADFRLGRDLVAGERCSRAAP